MSVKLKIGWTDNNVITEGVRIYKSSTLFDVDTLPAIYAEIIDGSLFYEDLDVIDGQIYFYMLSCFLGEQEVFTECYDVIAIPSNSWLPIYATVPPTYWFDAADVVFDSPTQISIASKVGSYSASAQNASIVGGLVSIGNPDAEITSFDLKDFLVSKRRFFVFMAVKNTATLASLFTQWLPGSQKYNAVLITMRDSTDIRVSYRRSSSSQNASIDAASSIAEPNINLILVQFDMVENTASIHVNGNEFASGNPGTSAFLTQPAVNALRIAGGSADTELQYGDMIGGNLGVLDQPDIDKYFGWAAHKYNVASKLPINHPYRYVRPTI